MQDNMMAISLPFRPFLERLAPYKPGEQIDGKDIIKLNTNENPYPPAQEVFDAICEGIGRLRLYPNPGSDALRQCLADYHGLSPDQVLAGNGSDEILRLLIQAFIEKGRSLAIIEPSYSLYPVIAEQMEGDVHCYALEDREKLPESLFAGDEPLCIIANPNPPMGTLYCAREIGRLCRSRARGLVVVDEAYVDFAPHSMVPLLAEMPNLAITRTFSKSFSLAGMRIGYLLGHPDLIGNLSKIKDSYNLNHLAQVAAMAAIARADTMQENCRTISAERDRISEDLRRMGFRVPESHGNFFFAIHPQARMLYRELKVRGILVRYFDVPGINDGIRVSVGTRMQMDRFMAAIRKILKEI